MFHRAYVMNLMSRYGCRYVSKVIFILFSIIVTLILGSSFCFAEEVTLQWNPSTSATVVGYKVYIKTVTENSYSVVDVGNVTNYLVRDLSKDKDYIFSVTAYDAKGSESSHSNIVNWSSRQTDMSLAFILKHPLRFAVALFAITIFAGIGILIYRRRKRKVIP